MLQNKPIIRDTRNCCKDKILKLTFSQITLNIKYSNLTNIKFYRIQIMKFHLTMASICNLDSNLVNKRRCSKPRKLTVKPKLLYAVVKFDMYVGSNIQT